MKLSVEGAGLAAGLNKAEGDTKASMQRMSANLGAIRNVAAVAFGAGVLALKSFGDAVKEKQGQVARFEAQMEILGKQFVINTDATERWASQMEKLHDFDAEDILQSFQRAASVTESYGDSVLFAETAMNAANLKGVELERTTQALAMAYAGNTRGLKNLGIILAEGVKGHEVLVQVQRKVAGGSELTADTIQRSERRMQIAWENSREKLGQDLMPTMIKLYDWLGKVADRMGQLEGTTVMYSTAIAGLVVAGLSAWKWAIDFRLALIAMRAATAGANAAGAGMLGWIGGIPGLVAVAIVAITALIAKFDQLAKAHDAAFDNKDKNAPTIMTSDGPKKPSEIANESRNDYQTKSALQSGNRQNSFLPFANWWIAAADAITGKSEQEDELASQINAARYQAQRSRRGDHQAPMAPPTGGVDMTGVGYVDSMSKQFRQGNRFAY